MAWQNHYETVFKTFLRIQGTVHFSNRQDFRVPLREDSSLKNFDFVVSTSFGKNLIVDIKGRLFPGGRSNSRYWKNWTTRDDLSGLLRWEDLFGTNFKSLLVFAYLIRGRRIPCSEEDVFTWRNRQYAFLAVDLHDYIARAKRISPRWDSYEMRARDFRAFARPFSEYLKRSGESLF